MEKQIVIFNLAGEQYGVNIEAVESIIKMQSITRLPHTPGFVEGITNLRGKVVPVIDLYKRFGLSGKEPGANKRIIVVNMAGTEVGVIVDGVSEVWTIFEQDVVPTPAIASRIDSTFITGIAKIDQRLVILLDIQKVLTSAEQAEFSGLVTA